jgi:hypothetical protein
MMQTESLAAIHLLITRFWSQLYAMNKYRNEKLAVGPENVFKEYDAQLASRHAEECRSAAHGVRWWFITHRSQ